MKKVSAVRRSAKPGLFQNMAKNRPQITLLSRRAIPTTGLFAKSNLPTGRMSPSTFSTIANGSQTLHAKSAKNLRPGHLHFTPMSIRPLSLPGDSRISIQNNLDIKKPVFSALRKRTRNEKKTFQTLFEKIAQKEKSRFVRSEG
ncbi:hypothetical protein AVEN_175693-1 [Araneus ventricosus]|uniref:Uncharacterized protein n=1 Tax=Araneus ventricosus TaxID=182803 RepID=A0A4Y2EXA6_ARAVE|nr:hypothetical protein AVEN_175693-1 [Araneus ventricosus]